MRTPSADFILEKNKSENAPIFLYEVVDYNGADSLFFAEHTADVTFDGNTYVKTPIAHEYIGENVSGQIDVIKVSIANVSRLIGAYLLTNEFRGKKIIVRIVFDGLLDDTDAVIEDTYYIDTYTVTEDAVEFTCSSKFDVLDLQLPARTALRNYCSWKFKSAQCGYDSTGTICNKTLAQCRAYANQERFGGFPSIPSDRIYAG